MKTKSTIYRITFILLCLFLWCNGISAFAASPLCVAVQDGSVADSTAADSAAFSGLMKDSVTVSPLVADSVSVDSVDQRNKENMMLLMPDTDSLIVAQADSLSVNKDIKFIPNPTRALWLSLIIPGAGQIYNRKYWKIPIVYGGFLGCVYALTWNGQMYKDYSQAYLDIMDDDPNTDSYMDMLPINYDITGKEERFKEIFKNKKNYYRKYRDLSIFCMVGVYVLSVIDAYVDAELSSFDISKDLSMKLSPAIINNTNIPTRQTGFGVQCRLNF